jgi:hypothetical protein
MAVPNEITLELYDLDVVVVHLRDNPGGVIALA